MNTFIMHLEGMVAQEWKFVWWRGAPRAGVAYRLGFLAVSDEGKPRIVRLGLFDPAKCVFHAPPFPEVPPVQISRIQLYRPLLDKASSAPLAPASQTGSTTLAQKGSKLRPKPTRPDVAYEDGTSLHLSPDEAETLRELVMQKREQIVEKRNTLADQVDAAVEARLGKLKGVTTIGKDVELKFRIEIDKLDKELDRTTPALLDRADDPLVKDLLDQIWCDRQHRPAEDLRRDQAYFRSWLTTRANVKPSPEIDPGSTLSVFLGKGVHPESQIRALMRSVRYRVEFADGSVAFVPSLLVTAPALVEEFEEFEKAKSMGLTGTVKRTFTTNPKFTVFKNPAGKALDSPMKASNKTAILQRLHQESLVGDGWIRWGTLRKEAKGRSGAVLGAQAPETLFADSTQVFAALVEVSRAEGVSKQSDETRLRLQPDVVLRVGSKSGD
jgi:hypothetical protein